MLALYLSGPRKNAPGGNGLAAFFSRMTIGWAVPYSPVKRNALMGDSGARRVVHDGELKKTERESVRLKVRGNDGLPLLIFFWQQDAS